MRIGHSWVVAGLVLAMSAGHGLAQDAASEPGPAPPWTLANTRKVYKQEMRFVNLFLSSCEYGVIGYGDQLVGGRAERVEKRLREHFGDRLNGHKVVLERYEFFQNGQIMYIRSTGAFAGGLIGGAMESSYNLNCKRKDTKSGWYDTKQFKPDPPPYVVEITIRIDDTVIASSAAAQPPKRSPITKEGVADPEVAAMIEAVQVVALDDVVSRIEAILPKAAAPAP